MKIKMSFNSSFAELLTRKLQIEKSIRTDKMIHLAKEICDMLRQMKYLGNEEEIQINRLAYSKMVVHRLLLCHGFSLKNDTQFNALDDAVLGLVYKSCYRNDFDYQADFILAVGFVKITFTRVLSNPPIDPATGEVSHLAALMECYALDELPTFEKESINQDYYTTEKILTKIIKKFSKLWIKFKNTSEPPTPADSEDDSESSS